MMGRVLHKVAEAEALRRGKTLSLDGALYSNFAIRQFMSYRFLSLPEVFKPLMPVALDGTLRLGASSVYRTALEMSDATLDVCYRLWCKWFQQHSKHALMRLVKEIAQCETEEERERFTAHCAELDPVVAAAKRYEKLAALDQSKKRHLKSASVQSQTEDLRDREGEFPRDGDFCHCVKCDASFEFDWFTCRRLCELESGIHVSGAWCAECSEKVVLPQKKKRRVD